MKKVILFTSLFCSVFVSVNRSFAREEIDSENPNNLVIDAENLYQNDRYQNSIESLKRAIPESQGIKDTFNEINSRRNLALVYLKTGDKKASQKTIITNLKQIDNLEDSKVKQELRASSLEIYKELYLETGKTETAIELGKEITNIYKELGDKEKENRSKINLAIALSFLGLYERAKDNLLEVKENLQDRPDRIKIATLLELGKIFIKIGNLSEADRTLKESLKLARQQENKAQISKILISLGDLNQVQENQTAAREYYQQALAIAEEPQTRISSKLKQLSLFVEGYNKPG